jgi:FkbH-like protein
LDDAIPGGRNRFLTKINLKISENLPIGLSFLDTGKLERELGEKFFSLPEWHRAFQYPALDALPLFAEHIAAHVRAVLGLAAKILVVDLDNTLWGGVTGEEGPEKILVGNGSALGQGYAALQKYLRELDDKGILLAVCSKNNLADAKEPFQKNKSMLLKLEDFIIFTANWQDKATNIKKMSQDLSLGLESFVFLDDNPVEREWVQTNLPEVIVPDCGSSPYTMLAALRRGLYFESIRVTTEDRSRYEDYKQNLNRRQFEAAAQEKNISKEEFLQTLRMEASCGNVDEKTLPRVTQLINKTNQFNLTSRRYSEEQVKKIAQAPDKWLKWYRLQDRFGDQGIVGIIIASKKETSWHIDTFLISCRVLGRQVENFMFADLAAAAKAANASSISAEYIPTPKNTLVKDLYPNWGFTYNPNTASYLFDLSLQKLPSCKISKKNTE